MTTSVDEKLRLDKWLWHARFFKTRSLASTVCRGGKVRLNGHHVTKASATVSADDILTFPRGDTVLVVKVLALGSRRGPAPEAQELYEDLTPPAVPQEKKIEQAFAVREKGSGRPTKAERRALNKLVGDVR